MGSRVGWFGLGAAAVLLSGQAAAQTSPADAIPLDPNAPLAPLPDIGVAWPDLGKEAPGTTTAAATDGAAERRYAWRIDGIDTAATPLLRQRFDELSTLGENDGSAANAAQLDRRAREDGDLLRTLLRGEGYYDARVTTRVEGGAKPLLVLAAEPGTLYRFKDVTLGGIAAADGKADTLRQAFGVKPDDPVNADAIVAGQAKLATTIGREGFPFADVGEPQIVVDHATKTATLDLAVAPGSARRFGKVVALPGNRVFDAHHVQEIARFTPGDAYDAASLDDLRRALIQTGLVSSVEVKPLAGDGADTVDVGVKLEPAPPRTIAGELGYGTGEGARAEISWTHRNLFPPEGALIVSATGGTQEQGASVTFRRSNAGRRDRAVELSLSALRSDFAAYEAFTGRLAGRVSYYSTPIWQKPITYSYGFELLGTNEQDFNFTTGQRDRRTYYVAALPGQITWDRSNDLLDPTSGFRLSAQISPEASLGSGTQFYGRGLFEATGYYPVGDNIVIAGRARVGSIYGADRADIAPSRRFYAGGGGSVRGFGYQELGPKDPDTRPIGGRSLVEAAAEVRYRFGNYGIVGFIDAGQVSTRSTPGFDDLRYGVGIGGRFYTNFGPMRLDVATPLGRRPGESRVAIYISIGQAF